MAGIDVPEKLIKLSLDNWMEENGDRFPDMKPSEPVRMFKFETEEKMKYFACRIKGNVIVRMNQPRHRVRVIRRGKNSAYASAVIEWERKTKLFEKLKAKFLTRLDQEGFDNPDIKIVLPHPIHNDELTEQIIYNEYYVYFIRIH